MTRLAILIGIAALAVGAAWPAASHAVFEYESSFGSAVSGTGRFAEPTSLATDSAGRVYVADAGAGRVEVYDNAADDNKFIKAIGQGLFVRPTGVWVDNRDRVYVADAGRNVGVFLDALVDDNDVRREFGGPGTALGKLEEPRQLTTDKANRIFVAERGTSRVQFFKASGGKTVTFGAFGTGEPPTFLDPEGIVREGEERFYLSNDSPTDGAIRAYDKRGVYLRTVAGPGVNFGEVSNPRGLARDGAGRILVADAGNHRVQVFAPFSARNVFIEAVGSPGSGAGQFNAPSAVAVARGARVYVADTGNGRIVRLRFDDLDKDGAIDARDTCVGLADPDQKNSDKDSAGDACDGDDDNDRVEDNDDKCPTSLRGVDGNKDGCGDPRSRIGDPENRKVVSGRLRRVGGTAQGDDVGISAVKVAIGRVRGGNCTWYDGRRFAGSGPCTNPVYFDVTVDPAGLRRRWEASVSIGRGSYRIQSRAVQTGGLEETVVDESNLHTFRVR